MTVLLIGPIFYEHVIALSQHFHNSLYGKRALDTLEQIMNEQPEVTAPHDPVQLKDLKSPSVSFQEVSFSYEQGREVLHNCSFEVKTGENRGPRRGFRGRKEYRHRSTLPVS